MTLIARPKLILVGGGGHCAACIDVIELENKYDIVGIVDNNAGLDRVSGYPVLGNDSMLSSLPSSVENALVTVGQINDPTNRIRLFEMITTLGFNHPTVISPRAYVSKHARVGKGTIIMHDALINAHAVVGDNVIINTKALIEHNAIIEDHCHVSTGVLINGGVHIRRGSFAGSNSTVTENTVSRENEFIRAGNLFRGQT